MKILRIDEAVLKSREKLLQRIRQQVNAYLDIGGKHGGNTALKHCLCSMLKISTPSNYLVHHKDLVHNNNNYLNIALIPKHSHNTVHSECLRNAINDVGENLNIQLDDPSDNVKLLLHIPEIGDRYREHSKNIFNYEAIKGYNLENIF